MHQTFSIELLLFFFNGREKEIVLYITLLAQVGK